MELNYKRRMRMPIQYLPGFRYGTSYLPMYASSYNMYGDTNDYFNIHGQYKPLNQSNFNFKGVAGKLGGNASNIMSSGMSFAGDLGNAFGGVKSSNDILDETGTRYSNGIGYGYQRINDVDRGAQLTELRKQNQGNTMKAVGSGAALGASVGMTFGPVGGLIGGAVGALGGLIGGLFGGAKRKRKMLRRLRQAEINAAETNKYNQSSAQSDYMANDYYNTNGTTQDDVLYAKRGKDKGYSANGMNTQAGVYTSQGKVNTTPNARVAAGESIIDNIDDTSKTTGHVVKDGKLGQDTNLANLGDSTIVLGQDVDWRNGMTFRDQSLPYTQALEKINKKYENRTNDSINKLRGTIGKQSDELQQQQVNKLKEPIVQKLKDLSEQQALQHSQQEMQNNYSMPGYTNGKNNTYGYIEPMSWGSNAIPMGIGMLTSLGQYFDAKGQKIHTPDIYAGNPYETAALAEMSKLNVNPYKAIQDVYKQDRVNRYAINRAGGLSGSQKYLANVAMGLGTQENISNTLQKAQEVNNQYRGKWAEAALNAGNALAQRRQQANQYNTEYTSQAHAARQQGMQMGIRNFMDYLQQYAANEYKRKTGNGMLGLYQQQQDLDRDKFNFNSNAGALNTQDTPNNKPFSYSNYYKFMNGIKGNKTPYQFIPNIGFNTDVNPSIFGQVEPTALMQYIKNYNPNSNKTTKTKPGAIRLTGIPNHVVLPYNTYIPQLGDFTNPSPRWLNWK